MIIKLRWQHDPADRDYKLMTVSLSPPLALGDPATKYQQRSLRARSLAPFHVVRESSGQLAFIF